MLSVHVSTVADLLTGSFRQLLIDILCSWTAAIKTASPDDYQLISVRLSVRMSVRLCVCLCVYVYSWVHFSLAVSHFCTPLWIDFSQFDSIEYCACLI